MPDFVNDIFPPCSSTYLFACLMVNFLLLCIFSPLLIFLLTACMFACLQLFCLPLVCSLLCTFSLHVNPFHAHFFMAACLFACLRVCLFACFVAYLFLFLPVSRSHPSFPSCSNSHCSLFHITCHKGPVCA